MKKNFTILCFMSFALIMAQEDVTVDASADWIGFANVFDLPEDGGAFVFGSDWGVPDIRTDIDVEANTLTLFPNFNTYADNPGDDFWINPDTGEGNKTFEGNTLIETTELVGSVVTFTGTVQSFTLSADYEVFAFIRVFNEDFSFNKQEDVVLTSEGDFEIIFDDVDEDNDAVVQYGFTVVGPNANPADEASLGNVVVTSDTFSNTDFEAGQFTVYPNPTNAGWNISAGSQVIERVELFNVAGKFVRTIQPKDENVLINSDDLSAGVYLAKISTANAVKTIKLIKN